jgi:hypothetical protein
VVPNGVRHHLGGRGGQHERRERRVGFQHRTPNLDQPQHLGRRDRSASFEAQHLAVRRNADFRQPARDEVDPAPQVVRCAQVDEAALDRRLAEEHRRGGTVARQRADRRDDEPVQAHEVVGRAAPGDLHLTVAGGELRGRLSKCAILHHEPAGEHGCEHRSARDHAERNERKPAAAAAQAGGDEPQRIRDATQEHR